MGMTMLETICCEQREGKATILLNRPKAVNAFNEQIHEEVYEAVNRAAEGDEVRCVVFRGSGRGIQKWSPCSYWRERRVRRLDNFWIEADEHRPSVVATGEKNRFSFGWSCHLCEKKTLCAPLDWGPGKGLCTGLLLIPRRNERYRTLKGWFH
jgi:hypothetical protein